MNDLKRQAIYTYIHNFDESDEIVDLSDMDKYSKTWFKL